MSRASDWKLTAKQRRRYRQQLKQCRCARQYRRIFAILEVDRGEPIAEVARRMGVSRQSVHQWMRTCQGETDPEVLADRPRRGRPSVWSDTTRELLQQWLAQSPEEHGYPAASWTVPLLLEQLRHVRGEELSEDTLRSELHRLGYTWKRPRYVLEPDPEREKKTPDYPAFVRFAAEECGSGRG